MGLFSKARCNKGRRTLHSARRNCKGQYRIMSEILLFSIGIMITGYVIINFNNLQEATKKITLRDQMENVADVVSTAIVKASTTANTSVRLTIPDKISGSIYRISIKQANAAGVGGGILNISTLDGSASVERQLFNMDYDNTNSNNNRIDNSEVTSSSQFIEVIKDARINLTRVRIGTG